MGLRTTFTAQVDAPTRKPFRQAVTALAFAIAMSAFSAPRADALDELCDMAKDNCRTRLLALIDAEKVGIDVAFWVMEDSRYYTRIIARKNAGVPVRVIMDARSSATYPLNQQAFDAFQNAGIPMMKKTSGGIMHMKMMLFAGQNTVEFGAANFSEFEMVPATPYVNYISNSAYYTDDPSIVNSFKTKFDDLWVSTSAYSVYANVTARTRTYPTFPISPDLNIPPGQSFATRLIKLENAETQKIDVAMYRITQQSHGDALIAAVRRGIPVRYIGETREYRLLSRLWVSWNMDRMYAAGVPMRVRAHEGLNHQKLVLLYGQGMSVAATEAKALDDSLAAGLDGLAARFYAKASTIVDIPWLIATGEDLRYPQVEGTRPPGSSLVNRYLERVHAAASDDPVVCRKFFDVLNLLAPPSSLMAPAVMLRVLARRAPQGAGTPWGVVKPPQRERASQS